MTTARRRHPPRRQPTAFFVSLGCPKNRIDTEVMLGLAEAAGFGLARAAETADVIVVNTCGFIGDAKRESIDTVLALARHKRTGRCRRLVVTGCLPQRYAEELARALPEVDHFLGAGDFPRIADALRGALPRALIAATPEYLYDHLSPRRLSQQPFTAYVKVSEGCDRRCAFCIIPRLRGPQRSRTPGSLEAEVAALCAGGVREVSLVAQDLTDYGSDLPGRPRLGALVRRLARVPGLRWLRLHYAYPTEIEDDLLEAIAGEPAVCKYLDVPLQHVDDAVLKAMRRGQGGAAARALVARLRRAIPGLTLRTTMLVGHPGETEAAFGRLRDFVREAELDHLGVFTFSREEGTAAATLRGRVPARVAEARRRALMRLQRPIARARRRALLGREIEVLVEGPSEESDLLLRGRHAGQAPEIDGCVYLALPEGLPAAPRPGDFVRTRVTQVSDYDLVAEVLGPAK
ncbi:MAG: 30S ribosomal protein S12 methylthiotransferase RimO [Deltaproteobacteria bacterium]|nr:30S ribosomal protein S12 methylthiotransferase RimO [Deltaproteobacteria bacterium]